MNPLKFYGFKVDEDAQEFIGEIYKVLAIMGLSSIEKAKFSAY